MDKIIYQNMLNLLIGRVSFYQNKSTLNVLICMIFVDTYGSGHKVILDYIYRVDEDFFPAHFRLALEYDLASVFAGSVARDAGMIREFKQMADRQFLISKNIDSSEVTTKQLDVNRYINLRNSTRTDV